MNRQQQEFLNEMFLGKEGAERMERDYAHWEKTGQNRTYFDVRSGLDFYPTSKAPTRIRIMRSWEKQEEKRVYRMEQLRRLHDAWQDQVELWDMDLIELKD